MALCTLLQRKLFMLRVERLAALDANAAHAAQRVHLSRLYLVSWFMRQADTTRALAPVRRPCMRPTRGIRCRVSQSHLTKTGQRPATAAATAAVVKPPQTYLPLSHTSRLLEERPTMCARPKQEHPLAVSCIRQAMKRSADATTVVSTQSGRVGEGEGLSVRRHVLPSTSTRTVSRSTTVDLPG